MTQEFNSPPNLGQRDKDPRKAAYTSHLLHGSEFSGGRLNPIVKIWQEAGVSKSQKEYMVTAVAGVQSFGYWVSKQIGLLDYPSMRQLREAAALSMVGSTLENEAMKNASSGNGTFTVYEDARSATSAFLEKKGIKKV